MRTRRTGGTIEDGLEVPAAGCQKKPSKRELPEGSAARAAGPRRRGPRCVWPPVPAEPAVRDRLLLAGWGVGVEDVAVDEPTPGADRCSAHGYHPHDVFPQDACDHPDGARRDEKSADMGGIAVAVREKPNVLAWGHSKAGPGRPRSRRQPGRAAQGASRRLRTGVSSCKACIGAVPVPALAVP